MPIDISDDTLSDVGQTIQNIDFETLSRIQKMEFGKAKTASVLDPQTGRDNSNQVKRQLSTLAGKIGRRLKYYNRKDFPNQIPEGRVGFEVISENTSPPEVKQMLSQLEQWRASQSANGAAEQPAEETPQETPQETPAEGQGNGSRSRR